MDVLFVQYNLRRNLYMKSTKRVLALGMASVMTLGLLSACGNKPSSDNNNQASTLVVGDGNYDGKFSPFFYTSAYDGKHREHGQPGPD